MRQRDRETEAGSERDRQKNRLIQAVSVIYWTHYFRESSPLTFSACEAAEEERGGGTAALEPSFGKERDPLVLKVLINRLLFLDKLPPVSLHT